MSRRISARGGDEQAWRDDEWHGGVKPTGQSGTFVAAAARAAPVPDFWCESLSFSRPIVVSVGQPEAVGWSESRLGLFESSGPTVHPFPGTAQAAPSRSRGLLSPATPCNSDHH